MVKDATSILAFLEEQAEIDNVCFEGTNPTEDPAIIDKKSLDKERLPSTTTTTATATTLAPVDGTPSSPKKASHTERNGKKVLKLRPSDLGLTKEEYKDPVKLKEAVRKWKREQTKNQEGGGDEEEGGRGRGRRVHGGRGRTSTLEASSSSLGMGRSRSKTRQALRAERQSHQQHDDDDASVVSTASHRSRSRRARSRSRGRRTSGRTLANNTGGPPQQMPAAIGMNPYGGHHDDEDDTMTSLGDDEDFADGIQEIKLDNGQTDTKEAATTTARRGRDTTAATTTRARSVSRARRTGGGRLRSQ